MLLFYRRSPYTGIRVYSFTALKIPFFSKTANFIAFKNIQLMFVVIFSPPVRPVLETSWIIKMGHVFLDANKHAVN